MPAKIVRDQLRSRTRCKQLGLTNDLGVGFFEKKCLVTLNDVRHQADHGDRVNAADCYDQLAADRLLLPWR